MIFRYPGGKRKAIRKITNRMPNFVREIREPFVGGGSFFFAIPTDVKRWINDIHPGLISVYTALRDNKEEFIKKCRDIKPASRDDFKVLIGKTLQNKRLYDKFQEMVKDRDKDQALSYFFINRTVWAGRVNYSLPSRLYYSNPNGWNLAHTNKMELAACHMKNAKITCGDYSVLLEESGEDVVIFADPPYVCNTEMPATDQQYEYNFTYKDHERFAKLAKKCVHKMIISYDDHKLVRELFAGSHFKIYEEEWKYSGSTLSKKKIGKELILVNY
mgnify:FL=1